MLNKLEQIVCTKRRRRGYTWIRLQIPASPADLVYVLDRHLRERARYWIYRN